MSKWIQTNLPCPCGKSSDAYSVDENGNGYCFSGTCKKFFNNKNEVMLENKKIHFDYYPSRGHSRKTLELYDIKTKFVDDVPYEKGYHYPWINGFKFRRLGDDVPKKLRFYTTDGMGNPGLYGKDKFDPGSKESITICEGMDDAPSMYEITRGQSACVSITSSANALRDCTLDFDYINSFKKIYLCFDSDDAGKQATTQVAPLFDYSKTYHVKYTKFKDPTEYLERGEGNELYESWKNARRFAPDSIISSFSEIERVLEESQEDQLATWPFKGLQNKLLGIFKGEVTCIKAPEGVGKTTLFRATEHHVLKTTKHPIGIIHLEEKNSRTVKGIVGYELEQDAISPESALSNKDILDGFKKIVQDDEGRVHIYSSWDVENEESFLANIRFLVVAAGCKIIFLDHITWLGTGLDSEDERKKLDRLSQKLKLMAEELGFALIEISAINDDGKTRGSRNISKSADNVVMLSRDNQSFDPVVRSTLNFVIEKSRLGTDGPAGFCRMNFITGKLENVEEFNA